MKALIAPNIPAFRRNVKPEFLLSDPCGITICQNRGDNIFIKENCYYNHNCYL